MKFIKVNNYFFNLNTTKIITVVYEEGWEELKIVGDDESVELELDDKRDWKDFDIQKKVEEWIINCIESTVQNFVFDLGKKFVQWEKQLPELKEEEDGSEKEET